MEASEDAEDAKLVGAEMGLFAEESPDEGVTKEGIARADDHARASFHLWSINPISAIFHYTPAEVCPRESDCEHGASD